MSHPPSDMSSLAAKYADTKIDAVPSGAHLELDSSDGEDYSYTMPDAPAEAIEGAQVDPVIEQGIRAVEQETGQRVIRSKTRISSDPPSGKFKFAEPDEIYKVVPKILTERYTGKDNDPRTDKFALNHSRCQMSVLIDDGHGGDHYVSHHHTLGKDKHFELDMKFNVDTQYPSISVYITQKGVRPRIECRIFASSTSRMHLNVNKEQIRAEPTNWIAMNDNVQQQRLDDDDLMQVRVTCKGDCQAVWNGITPQELNEIHHHGALNPEELTAAEQAILALSTGVEVSLVRHKARKHATVEEFNTFVEIFQTLANIAIEHGDFWWYKMQGQTESLASQDIVLDGDKAKPPRWLVTDWYTVFDIDGDILATAPQKWSGFNIPPVWASVETVITAHKLYLARARPAHTVAMQNCLDKQAGNIASRWQANLVNPGWYKVEISCNFTGGDTLNREDMIPAIGSALSIMWRQEDGDWSRFKFRGITVADLWQSGAPMVAHVFGQPNSELERGNTVMLRITLEEDSISIKRQMDGLTMLWDYCQTDDYTQTAGPDWIYHLMGHWPKMGENNPWLSSTPQNLRQGIVRDMARAGCNNQQVEFARLVCTDSDGISICIGPPGTGKSFCIANLLITMLRYIKKGYKILVTAASNSAVDTIIKALVRLDPELLRHEIARFHSAAFNVKRRAALKSKAEDTVMTGTEPEADKGKGKATDVDTDMGDTDAEPETTDDASLCFFELLDATSKQRQKQADLSKYSFDVRFRRFVQDIAKPCIVPGGQDHPLRQGANAYLDAIKRMNKEPGNREQHRATKALVQRELEDAYFSEKAQIVGVTLDTGAHDKLESFRPDLLVIDECGVATVEDTFATITANIDSLQHCLMAGDPKQQRAMVMNPKQNELSGLHETSFLEKAVNPALSAAGSTLKSTMLTQQYRMHPEIADVISRVWYDGRLTSDTSFQQNKGQGLMAQECFKSKLGAAYDNWNFFAVSVDGPDAYSQKFRNTTSLQNNAEAGIIDEMAKALFAQTSNNPRAVKIEKKDLLVLSPYAGQSKNIWQLLFCSGLMSESTNRPRCQTVATIQGDEEHIVFVSFTANREGDPLNIKFAVETHSLDVALSRGKCMVVLVGNFLEWTKAMKRQEFANDQRGFKAMEHVLKLLCPENGPCRIVSSTDLLNGFANNTPATEAEFPKLVAGIRPIPKVTSNVAGERVGPFKRSGPSSSSLGKRKDLGPRDFNLMDYEKTRPRKSATQNRESSRQTDQHTSASDLVNEVVMDKQEKFRTLLEGIPLVDFDKKRYTDIMTQVDTEEAERLVREALDKMARRRYKEHQELGLKPGHYYTKPK